MDNNAILIGIKYALDISNEDMLEIFKLGGVETTSEIVSKMLMKSKNTSDEVDESETIDPNIECDNEKIEGFLNGLIIFKRGRQEPKPGQPEKQVLSIVSKRSVNNVMLKKLKIALALSSEDMIDILEEAGNFATKGELSVFFRKEGHKHYKYCNDQFAKSFLDGLAKRNRLE